MTRPVFTDGLQSMRHLFLASEADASKCHWCGAGKEPYHRGVQRAE